MVYSLHHQVLCNGCYKSYYAMWFFMSLVAMIFLGLIPGPLFIPKGGKDILQSQLAICTF